MHASNSPAGLCMKRVYLADPSHSAVDPPVPLAGLHRFLLEEEINFVVVWTVSVRNGEGAHKVRL